MAARTYFVPNHESELIASKLETVLRSISARADLSINFQKYHLLCLNL
jgi:hypothetical protein